MPEPLPRYLGSGAPGWLTRNGSNWARWLKGTFYLELCELWPPCHPLEPQLCLDMTLTTQYVYVASSSFLFSATTRACYCPHFPAEEREVQEGRVTCSRSHRCEGAERIVTQFCALSHRGRLFQLPSSGGSSELHSLAQMSSTQKGHRWMADPGLGPAGPLLLLVLSTTPWGDLEPHFPVEETEAQGREVTHTGLIWTGPSIWVTRERPFTHITLRATGLAGASLGLNTLFIPRTLLFDWVVMPGALGLCQPGTPGPGSTDGCPLDIRLGALAEISGSSRVFSSFFHLLLSRNL